MSTPLSSAVAAYGNASQLVGNPSRALQSPNNSSGPDFGKMVLEGVQSVVDSGNRADTLSMDMLNGEANVVDVVTAIAETEIAVEGMVAVRDRVISAYEEIMRMPI